MALGGPNPKGCTDRMRAAGNNHAFARRAVAARACLTGGRPIVVSDAKRQQLRNPGNVQYRTAHASWFFESSGGLGSPNLLIAAVAISLGSPAPVAPISIIFSATISVRASSRSTKPSSSSAYSKARLRTAAFSASILLFLIHSLIAIRVPRDADSTCEKPTPFDHTKYYFAL